MIETWERCTDVINGMGSLSGIHTWRLVKEAVRVEGKKEMVNVVRCHRCDKEPPLHHRDRLLEEQEDFEDQNRVYARMARVDRMNRRGS